VSQIPDHYHQVGPGWVNLLGALHEKLVELQPAYQVSQVKQKFGGLRIYLDYDPELRYPIEVGELIDAAEVVAAATCEECGQPGKLREGSWLMTLCDACQKAHEARRKQRWS
jgi:hypothetical protein